MECLGSDDGTIGLRRCGVAFRLGMMTQPEEVFRSRFQESQWVAFRKSKVGANAIWRGFQTLTLR